MRYFAALQDRFQRGVLDGDDSVLGEIVDSPQEKRNVLFDVYRNAYRMRLVEIVQHDHELLHAYLGDEAFNAMARAYIDAHPSGHSNARWFSQGLPDFLKSASSCRDDPEIAELASIEKALNDSFDAADAAILTLDRIGKIPPAEWNSLCFVVHPSAARIDVSTNAAAIWIALKEDRAPPAPVILAAPARLLVWRQDLVPKFRELQPEEAMMWDEAARGVPFGGLCEMLAFRDDPDGAAARAAAFLHAWITSGLLSEAL